MRESITKKEFNGSLKIENHTFENVRCVYEDDFYSNKLMSGEFYLNENHIPIDLLNNPFHEFIFRDNNGRTLNGIINGMNLKTEFNEPQNIFKFKLKDFTKWIRLNKNKPVSLKILYNIPYVEDLSREIMYSHDFSPEFIFKFIDEPFKINVNGQTFEFYEKVYCYIYKEPDSILARELYIKTTINENVEDIVTILNNYESIIDDIMLIVSFLFNHRTRSYSYFVEFFDENGVINQTIEYKESNRSSGEDCLKESGRMFKKYLTHENLSMLIESFVNQEPEKKKNIRKIIYKFLTLEDILILEAKFLSGFALLESISKFIVIPNKRTKSEELIKEAIRISNVDSLNFKTSRHRVEKNKSNHEFEISEIRDELMHFNGVEFIGVEMYEEYEKIHKMSRRLILWSIKPELANWGFPNE